MRKLIFAINISLDGVCDHTKFSPDEETYGYFIDLVRSADTFVYGRKTYELMVPYWPDIAKNLTGEKAENDYAQAFDSVKKIILVSRSLEKVEHEKTEIVHTDIHNAILKLKQQEGKNILLGGVDLASQLIESDLIDEFRFVVHPIFVGEGRRLFEGINPLRLKLVESKTFRSGSILLRYVKQ